ncbi:hypothetical protein BJ956_002423 [Arthrobacter psychrochitiniphilus]|nr:hypothetical protein [Arthrobacter psychrochitiniphilus]
MESRRRSNSITPSLHGAENRTHGYWQVRDYDPAAEL